MRGPLGAAATAILGTGLLVALAALPLYGRMGEIRSRLRGGGGPEAVASPAAIEAEIEALAREGDRLERRLEEAERRSREAESRRQEEARLREAPAFLGVGHMPRALRVGDWPEAPRRIVDPRDPGAVLAPGGLLSGAHVTAVVPGSAAERAGLRLRDLVVRIGEERVRSSDDLVRVVQRHHPRERVEIVAWRPGPGALGPERGALWRGAAVLDAQPQADERPIRRPGGPPAPTEPPDQF